MPTEVNLARSFIDETSRVVVLGAGPAGLAAAIPLARAGLRPLIVERSKWPGGMMRGIKLSDCQVDLGRKEMYERIPLVANFWEELLQDQFVPYPHRIGILYGKSIFEYKATRTSPLRGISSGFACRAALSFLKNQIGRPFAPPPQNLAEYWYRLRGQEWTQAMFQGFDEKFKAIPWRDRPVPSQENEKVWQCRSSIPSSFKDGFKSEKLQWRHPAKGTQQIVDRMCAVLDTHGADFLFEASAEKIHLRDGIVESVDIRSLDGVKRVTTASMISAIPVMRLAMLLGKETPELAQSDHNKRRLTLIAYIVTEQPSPFPHAWLEVSCPNMKIGRITNYTNFGGTMVPEGKIVLGLEVFTHVDDPFATGDDDQIIQKLITEACAANLINKECILEHQLIRIPGCEASNSCATWMSEPLQKLTADLKHFSNLYDVNRAGIDISVFAGLLAGQAVVSGTRVRFDREADPSRSHFSEDRGDILDRTGVFPKLWSGAGATPT